MANLLELQQGGPEWKAVRLGKLTASRMADAIAKTKTGWGASRANLLAALVAERLTGESQESFTNAAMQWGTEKEPEARAAYAFHFDVDVAEIGFACHPTVGDAGASPDGLVAEDGLVEIKCPNTATHIDTLLGQSVPARYVTQIMWQMACTGRKWCDFVSYDPRLPEEMRLFVKRIHRDEAVIAELESAALIFLGELSATVARLQGLYPASRGG